MISRIQEGMAEVEAFAGDVAHQLRTPLNALRNQLEVTLEKERSPEEYRRVLGDVQREVVGFAGTVDAMLRLARSLAGVEAGRLAPLALAPLLQTVLDFFEPAAEEKGVEVHRGAWEEAVVCGDSAWLQQLFANLLDNAIRFTPAGGSVEIELRRAGTEARVRVRDSGVGVAPEERGRLFERFRAGGHSRGAGLGLAIAAHIARAHGGSIEVESTPGDGATFSVRLPLAAQGAGA
jgi:two-component system heavy metal sensor histidine kinase CusS